MITLLSLGFICVISVHGDGEVTDLSWNKANANEVCSQINSIEYSEELSLEKRVADGIRFSDIEVGHD